VAQEEGEDHAGIPGGRVAIGNLHAPAAFALKYSDHVPYLFQSCLKIKDYLAYLEASSAARPRIPAGRFG
jgi:hypothetical protein